MEFYCKPCKEGYPSKFVECPVCNKTLFAERYRIDEKIGSGGGGTVYKARDIKLGRIVALKILNYRVDKFKQETQNLSKLRHDNIVVLHDADENPSPYLAMEYLDGENLFDRIQRGLSNENVAKITKKLAKAVQYVHETGLFHLDIKPSNVILKEEDGQEEPILFDFGLSRSPENDHISQMTSNLGTRVYMAPEQVYGEDISARTDIYLLGGTMYEMLTKSAPFKTSRKLKPPKELNSNVNECLAAICLKCLENDPKNRYQTAGELVTALEELQQTPQTTLPPREESERSEPVSVQIQLSTNTIEVILKERRNGDSLEHIFNEFWKKNADKMKNPILFPFDVMSLQKGEYLDFTTPEWVILGKTNVENQIKNATAYQEWYAKNLGIAIEQKFPLNEKITIKMMLIPPGKYWQGSPPDEEGRQLDEKQRKVLISKAFWCGKYPVTQEQWESVTKSNPSHFKNNPQNPVEQVSWNKCQAFCTQTKMKLSNEAQWEYACRAGTTTPYHFGDHPTQLGDYAWYEKNSEGRTHPIDQKNQKGQKDKKTNAFGLYEMHGNVWEWCEDDYNEIYGGDAIDPEYKADSDSYRWPGVHKVCRGGSWFDYASFCRSADRVSIEHDRSANNFGFRVQRACS